MSVHNKIQPNRFSRLAAHTQQTVWFLYRYFIASFIDFGKFIKINAKNDFWWLGDMGPQKYFHPTIYLFSRISADKPPPLPNKTLHLTYHLK